MAPQNIFGVGANAPVIFVEHNNIPQSCALPSLWARIGSRGLVTLMATVKDSIAGHRAVSLDSRIEIPWANLAADFLAPITEIPRGNLKIEFLEDDLKIVFLDLRREVLGPNLNVETQRTKTRLRRSGPVAERLGTITDVEKDVGVKKEPTWNRTRDMATWDDTKFPAESAVLIRREIARPSPHRVSG